MIERAQVIGAGRVGSAMAARLRERGLDLSTKDPELVLLCVPDRAIAEPTRPAPITWALSIMFRGSSSVPDTGRKVV